MSGVSVSNSNWERGAKCYATACLWGSALVSGASSAYYISRSRMAIAVAIDSLPKANSFDPLVFTLGVPSLFGLIGTVMIPVHLYKMFSDLCIVEPWKNRSIALLKNIGNLGVAIGSTAQTVMFIWAEMRPHLSWLPVFQLVSATIAGTDVVLSGIHLHRLKRLDAHYSALKELPNYPRESQRKIFTEECAEKYLSVPKVRFQEFSEALAKEPDRGLQMLRARIKTKIFEQRLRVAAGVISILALAVLTGIAVAPTPLSPVAITALTIIAYFFSGTSSLLSIGAIWKNVTLLNPYFGSRPKGDDSQRSALIIQEAGG